MFSLQAQAGSVILSDSWVMEVVVFMAMIWWDHGEVITTW